MSYSDRLKKFQSLSEEVEGSLNVISEFLKQNSAASFFFRRS